MSLPYFLGCPSWSENAWRQYLYPQDARPNQFLELYSQVFNAVEGNTTFYARPAPATVERWAQTMPRHFRFTAKFPSDISHGGDLREQLTGAESFVQLLSPLGERVAPFWLQLSKAFTPQRLPELAGFIDGLQRPLAVEVRHRDFFARAMPSASSIACCLRVALSGSAWIRERCSVAPRTTLGSCMRSRRNLTCRLARQRSPSARRCASSVIRCCWPMIRS